jgi:hypothetical protein
MPPKQLQLPAVPGYTQPNYEGLMMLEASLRSPDSFMPRSFITADATTPAPNKARKVPDDAPGDAAGQVRTPPDAWSVEQSHGGPSCVDIMFFLLLATLITVPASCT